MNMSNEPRGQEHTGQSPPAGAPAGDADHRLAPRAAGTAAAGRPRGVLWSTLAVTWTIAGVLLAAAAAVYILNVTGVLSPPALRDWFGSLLRFEQNTLAANIVTFFVAGVIVWVAGTKLSAYADVIAERTGLGRAFVGLLLLATATSLPEVATTLTAGAIGNAQLMTSNLLGGIAMQTTILAVMDLLLVRKSPLTFFAPDPKLLIDGIMLIALLTLVVVGWATDSAISFWGVGITPLAIFALFVFMLWATHGERLQPKWKPMNPPPRPEDDREQDDRKQLDGENVQRRELEQYRGTSNRKLYLLFGVGALAILIAGYLLARTGDAIATQTGIGSTMIGAVLIAVGTSLPEISTTAKAVRLGAHGMAISNIFGSNAFCVALLFVGDVAYRKGPVLGTASPSDVLLTALGMLVTCAYLWGMLERRDRTFVGMGIASLTVLVLYFGGLVVLYSIT